MAPRPTQAQLATTREVVRWYFDRYHGKGVEPGLPEMFCDPGRVGAFAVDRRALRAGNGDALFKLLVATTMFQRRQDVQILRILRGMAPAAVGEVTDAARLLQLVDGGSCEHMRTISALRERCDLAKDPISKQGCCSANPGSSCHMKQHTVWLKRYGHFGKVPTSAALLLREAGVGDLKGLRARALRVTKDPEERAQYLEATLSRSWRISQKIACMFLSAVANPDLWLGRAPWQRGIDWTQFVVIDSNVDLFLRSIGFPGPWTYDHRRAFLCRLADRIPLDEFHSEVHRYNPRLVQQAIYLFMSVTNRRNLDGDCMHDQAENCPGCPIRLARRCLARKPAHTR